MRTRIFSSLFLALAVTLTAACGGGDPDDGFGGESDAAGAPSSAATTEEVPANDPATATPNPVVNPDGPVDRGTPAADPVVPAGGHAAQNYQECVAKANRAPEAERPMLLDACKLLPGAPR